MSSAVLYLAIVALWAVVLVPMWLRRDTEVTRPGLSWLPHRRPMMMPEYATAEHTATGAVAADAAMAEHADASVDVLAAHSGAHSGDDSAADPGDAAADDFVHRPGPSGPRAGRRGRGAVMARRRRRTWGLSLLVLAAVGVATAGLVPYWGALPPIGLLAGHLALLRVAADIDAARREAAAQARAAERAEARAARAAREAAAEAAQAEIIDLMARNRARGVFDQYAHDELRVVGD